MHCTPIKIQAQAITHWFGWTGGFSELERTIEMNRDLGISLGFASGQMIEAQIEYSFTKLESVELVPLTKQDFITVESNSEFIEQNLLNQMQVFYRD